MCQSPLSSSSNSAHSCSARPFKWPASYRRLSSAVHWFHCAARVSAGKQSSKRISGSSPEKGSTGGAFPCLHVKTLTGLIAAPLGSDGIEVALVSGVTTLTPLVALPAPPPVAADVVSGLL